MLWAIIVGFVGLLTLGVGINIWTDYKQPPKKGETPKPPVVKTQEQRGREKKTGAITSLVGLLILAGVFGWHELYYQSTEQIKSRQATEADRSCGNNATAYRASQKFVEGRLRAPSTASFPRLTEVRVVPAGDCKFKITAYVDAQNGFGAQVRTHYTVTMESVPQSKAWRAIDLNLIQ